MEPYLHWGLFIYKFQACFLFILHQKYKSAAILYSLFISSPILPKPSLLFLILNHIFLVKHFFGAFGRIFLVTCFSVPLVAYFCLHAFLIPEILVTCIFYASFVGCIFWSHAFLIPQILVTHFFFASFLGHIFLVTCFSNTWHIGHMFFLYLISRSHISVTYFCGHTFSGRTVTL